MHNSTLRYVLLLISLLVFAPSRSLAADPPNIVFFFADDQTISTLGCYGNEVIQTPNIDGLARRGTRFKNAFVSHSICWVSRTTILSGLTGRTYGTPGNRDQARPEAVATLYSDILRDAGYRTGYFGKWHAKMPRGYRREDHFDEFQAIGRNPFYKKQPDGSLRHETELIVDRGIDFIKSQPKGKPFALNMWFNACHAEDGDRRPGIGHFPWPRAVDGMYEDVEIAAPRLSDPDIFNALPAFLKTTINRERFFWRWNTSEKYQTNVRAYYRMVSGIDGAIGRFMKALEEAGLAGNTIIVYSADNGYYMGNRGLAGKWSHYEESLRIPMVIHDPRSDASLRGRAVPDMVLNLDVAATLLDLAGVRAPKDIVGRSLAPFLQGRPPRPWREDFFCEHLFDNASIPKWEGVRDQRWVYARYFEQQPEFEFLHDLQSDPDQLVNLATQPDHQGVMRRMRERCVELRDAYGGPYRR